MSARPRPEGAWAVPVRAAFSSAHRAVAEVRATVMALRRLRLVCSVRLQALWFRSRVEVVMAPDVSLGRRVRVAVEPGATAALTVAARCKIGDDVRITLRDGGRVELGDGVDLRRLCQIGTSGLVRIDGPTLLQNGCIIHCDEDVHIGDHTGLGEYVTVVDSSHFRDDSGQWWMHNVASRPVRIGPDAWIGAKATVARGVVVGAGAVVAANSLVVREVPPGSVVSGVPAEVVRDIALRPRPRPVRAPVNGQPTPSAPDRSASSSS